jgi:hypothetical protein
MIMIDPHKIIRTYKEPTYRSEIKIGNLTVYNEKRFNWFNRLMMKTIFGWEVTNYKKEENQC